MELRCVNCHKLLIREIEYNERSDQDFVVKVECQRCGARNAIHIEYDSLIRDTDCVS